MSKQLRELQARKAGLIKEARALTDRAAAESRDMNDEETSAFDALKTRIEAASAAIDRESALIAEEAQMAMTVDASAGNYITVTDNREADPLHGFRTAGEFMQAVYQAEKPGKSLDERLLIGGGRGAAAPGPLGGAVSPCPAVPVGGPGHDLAPIGPSYLSLCQPAWPCGRSTPMRQLSARLSTMSTASARLRWRRSAPSVALSPVRSSPNRRSVSSVTPYFVIPPGSSGSSTKPSMLPLVS